MTEQQKIEKLLAPRLEVIALWPGHNAKVGEIFEYDMTNTHDRVELAAFEQYPHLFRPLSWWEHRRVEEMPEYVKMNIDCRIPMGTILKANWESYKSDNIIIIAHRGKNPDFWIDAKYFEPATQSEYASYQTRSSNKVK